MNLNRKLLYLVAMVQDYKNMIISQNGFYKAVGKNNLIKDWYKETQEFYNSLGDETLKECGLSTNICSYEKVLNFKITNEINSTSFEELDKFKF